MKTAVVNSSSLIGKALRDQLRDSQVLQADSLLTTDQELIGTLADTGDEAALIQGLTGSEADLYLVCGTPEQQQKVDDQVDSRVLIHVEPTTPGTFDYAVAGLTSFDSANAVPKRVYCPTAVGIALTHLLAPLADLKPSGSAIALQGASSAGGGALDELLEQTRSILSFSGDMPKQTLSVQLAFNAVDTLHHSDIEAEVSSLLPQASLAVRTIDVGIFHGVGLSVDLTLTASDDPASDLAGQVLERLQSSPYIEPQASDQPLGTVDGAAADHVKLGRVESRAYGVNLWAVFDNLTLSARNAVELAEGLATNRLIAN